jgi:hypothetical protein
MTKRIIIVFSISIFVITCIAQAIRFYGTINWGQTVHGTQLAIETTNDIAVIGSTITLTERIRNQSQDAIRLIPAAPKSYVLTDELGKTHYLILQHNVYPYQPSTATVEVPEKIKAGEKKEWSISLKVAEDIEPGDYELEDVRCITTESNEVFALKSNSLNMKVAK